MKEIIIKAYLVVCSSAAILLFMLLMLKPSTTITNVELSQRAYNDSVLISEYQQALDSFIRVNPKAADQFMKLVENVNIK